MSVEHPIIAVTGSSGAGTSTVREAFENIFTDIGVNPAVIEGDSFHKYTRSEMYERIKVPDLFGRRLTHFSPDGNHFDRLEKLFNEYSLSGTGEKRLYLHNEEEAAPYPGLSSGEFTDWQPVPTGSDLLFYEGLHGGLVTKQYDIAQYVDLLIGVAPTTNLEWIQKICRDSADRGYSHQEVVNTIVRRMPDYVTYISPQFSRTDVNFQRLPIIDTANPFDVQEIPSLDESLVIVHLLRPEKFTLNIDELRERIQNSFSIKDNQLIMPAEKMVYAMEILLTPMIKMLVEKHSDVRAQAG
ncbi:MAG: phosphoribulokinase [Gammaproteobacteria bacterium]|nr:phosphoribulokinase [Gammaproteobacteria bacterium]